MDEAEFQDKFMKKWKMIGAEVLNVHGHAMQAAGWPDLYIASLHWTGWVELKVKAVPVKEIQRQRLIRLNERGIPAYVLRLDNFGQEFVILTYDREPLWIVPLGTPAIELAELFNSLDDQMRLRGILKTPLIARQG